MFLYYRHIPFCMVDLIKKFKEDFDEKIGGKNLKEWSRFLSQKNRDAFLVAHTGTLYKLYTMFSYTRRPYLEIFTNPNKPKGIKTFFIDLYGGNGLNQITDPEHFLCGSSILAFLASYSLTEKRHHDSYFDHLISIDKKKKIYKIVKR